jgi:hypothetical protein
MTQTGHLHNRRSFTGILRDLLIHPFRVFPDLRGETLLSAFLFFCTVLLISTGIGMALVIAEVKTSGTPQGIFMAGSGATVPDVLTLVSAGVIAMLAYIVLVVLFAVLMHAAAWMLGAKGGAGQSYKVLFYSQAPALLFGWIPGIGILFQIYSFFLGITGVSQVQRISWWSALAAFLFTVLLGILCRATIPW